MFYLKQPPSMSILHSLLPTALGLVVSDFSSSPKAVNFKSKRPNLTTGRRSRLPYYYLYYINWRCWPAFTIIWNPCKKWKRNLGGCVGCWGGMFSPTLRTISTKCFKNEWKGILNSFLYHLNPSVCIIEHFSLIDFFPIHGELADMRSYFKVGYM